MYYPVDETAEAVGAAPQTVRNWISSGVVPIPQDQRFGKRRYTGLTKHDVITVMIAAELSHLGVGPKSFCKIVPQIAYRVIEISIMLDATWQNFNDLDFVEKLLQEKEQPQLTHPIKDNINNKRYCIVYYDPDVEGNVLKCVFGSVDSIIYDAQDKTIILLDALKLANKARTILEKLPMINKSMD